MSPLKGRTDGRRTDLSVMSYLDDMSIPGVLSPSCRTSARAHKVLSNVACSNTNMFPSINQRQVVKRRSHWPHNHTSILRSKTRLSDNRRSTVNGLTFHKYLRYAKCDGDDLLASRAAVFSSSGRGLRPDALSDPRCHPTFDFRWQQANLSYNAPIEALKLVKLLYKYIAIPALYGNSWKRIMNETWLSMKYNTLSLHPHAYTVHTLTRFEYV